MIADGTVFLLSKLIKYVCRGRMKIKDHGTSIKHKTYEIYTDLKQP
jgi:hypothetical protein